MANTNSNKTYLVKNRSASTVIYRIPEMGIRSEFAPGETKRIGFQELERLTYQPGGRNLMANFLQIQDETVTEKLNIPTEEEYYMTEEQVIELLKKGTAAEFEDCLNFAPDGVIQLVKHFAVKLPLNDAEKRKLLKEKTDFDVDSALKLIEPSPEEGSSAPVAKSTSAPVRKSNASYKVVKREE